MTGWEQSPLHACGRWRYRSRDYLGNALYENGARMYDASLGRWHAVDPLAEKYAEVSPYVYCGNSPVNGMDPDGRDWYRHNDTGSYYWQEGHKNRDGYTRLGASVSIELGKDTYFNAYQNGGILANRAVNAFDLIRSSSALRNRFLGKYSPLSEQSKSELFNALNNRDLNDLGRPVGEALVEFSIAQFGGFVLSKALGWGLGRLAAEGAAKTVPQYTKSSLKLGQEMHKAYHAGKVGKEFRLPSGKRIDFLDIDNGIIYELKPFNPRAMKAGQKQLEMYLKELQTMPRFKDTQWKTVLDTY